MWPDRFSTVYLHVGSGPVPGGIIRPDCVPPCPDKGLHPGAELPDGLRGVGPGLPPQGLPQPGCAGLSLYAEQ